MSFSKSKNFNEYSQYISLICKAMAHPARVYIIKEIISSHGKGVCFQSLLQKIPLAQSTISQHLAYLRKMGIIYPKASNVNTYVINLTMNYTIVELFHLVANSYSKAPKMLRKELKALKQLDSLK